ncbi:endothelin-3-like [Myxocyprinus asiaticus]|uniref:endothelin-3-like n=1 Tax=Myxocyprinus asiaticus TaxID=70543 RepID=UPI002223B5AA|nr:endothelin-3-like [Myxocyprinus asiaticus]
MAKMVFDAVLLILSLVNIFTVGTFESQDSHVRSSEEFSSGVLHQQTEAALNATSHTRARSKRCTCYSYRDIECVYYCHLGIIWINTPQHTVPYGLSTYRSPQRFRRSSGTIGFVLHHCKCADHNDALCHNFCDSRLQNTVPDRRLK